jgi:deoxyadenosine/deoxycytidine kinase
MNRIEICGGIASGKTTLGQLLETNGFQVSYEDFRSNPFWEIFYNDPKRYAFETELTFLLQHYNQTKLPLDTLEDLVLDTSLVLDLAYADVNLHNKYRDAFDTVFAVIMSEVSFPEMLIYLSCSPEIELRRIRARGRPEEDAIDISYLTAINEAVQRRANEFSSNTKLMVIESDKIDFAKNQHAKADLAASILDRFHKN